MITNKSCLPLTLRYPHRHMTGRIIGANKQIHKKRNDVLCCRCMREWSKKNYVNTIDEYYSCIMYMIIYKYSDIKAQGLILTFWVSSISISIPFCSSFSNPKLSPLSSSWFFCYSTSFLTILTKLLYSEFTSHEIWTLSTVYCTAFFSVYSGIFYSVSIGGNGSPVLCQDYCLYALRVIVPSQIIL